MTHFFLPGQVVAFIWERTRHVPNLLLIFALLFEVMSPAAMSSRPVLDGPIQRQYIDLSKLNLATNVKPELSVSLKLLTDERQSLDCLLGSTQGRLAWMDYEQTRQEWLNSTNENKLAGNVPARIERLQSQPVTVNWVTLYPSMDTYISPGYSSYRPAKAMISFTDGGSDHLLGGQVYTRMLAPGQSGVYAWQVGNGYSAGTFRPNAAIPRQELSRSLFELSLDHNSFSGEVIVVLDTGISSTDYSYDTSQRLIKVYDDQVGIRLSRYSPLDTDFLMSGAILNYQYDGNANLQEAPVAYYWHVKAVDAPVVHIDLRSALDASAQSPGSNTSSPYSQPYEVTCPRNMYHSRC